MIRTRSSCCRWISPLIGFTIVVFLSCGAADAQQAVARFSMTVDFGADIGQSFGSLFEAKDEQGRVVAGAGFSDVYNTRFRSDRHTLQFFVRPPGQVAATRIRRLAHPDLDCGVYLFDFNRKLYAWTGARGNRVKLWDEGRWRAAPPPLANLRSGDGVMRLGNGVLSFLGQTVKYDERTILTPPTSGRDYNYYYAQGHLFFYNTLRKDGGGHTKIYACPWTPEGDAQIDRADAIVLDAKYVGATPFVYGQLGEEVMTVTNQGGVHLFDAAKKRWKSVLEADNQVSYQVYSAVNYYDRLLMAQYPTGNLFEYSGGKPKHLVDWPPRIPGVQGSAREAQTMAIYRGELFVGVWPWAELWRRDRAKKEWSSLGRMFTHPATTDKRTHPYEEEANRLKLVTNHWGQRVSGLTPIGENLMIGTSSKGTYEWSSKYKFLTDQQRREYGAVLSLNMPGNLAAGIRWTGKPVEFEFVVLEDGLQVRQDGRTIAATKERFPTTGLKSSRIEWGKGVYGSLAGKILKKSSN